MPGKEIVLQGPPKAAPISAGALAGDTLYVSGQLGQDPSTGALVSGGVAAEARAALANLRRVVEAAGLSLPDVVKSTVLLKRMDDFADVNQVYREFFPSRFPARICYQAGDMPGGGAVEIEAIAVRNAARPSKL